MLHNINPSPALIRCLIILFVLDNTLSLSYTIILCGQTIYTPDMHQSYI